MPRVPNTVDKPAPAAQQARSPELYSRRVLLCMAGLTPATITETLYALVVPPTPPLADGGASRHPGDPEAAAFSLPDPLLAPLSAADAAAPTWRPPRLRRERRPFVPFVPTEIHLITTVDGERAMLAGLLEPAGGAPAGVLVQLQADYAEHFGAARIQFGPGNLHVIRHPDGTPVHDFATDEDSQATGNAIVRVLRDLVADDDCAIHASYAGGRKSMSAMLVLAMSLLGRKQDRLSQVLIPQVFEVREFLYPPPQPRVIQVRDGRQISTAEARITLATLPLLRVFDGLGLKLRDPHMSFEAVIELGEMALEKQVIVVKPMTQSVQIGHLACKLTAAEVGLYTLLAVRRLAGAMVADDPKERAGGVRWRRRWKTDTLVGFDAGDPCHLQASRWFDEQEVPVGEVDLRSRVSTINRKLKGAFGPELAEQALIVGPSKGTKGDGIYGLFNADGLYVSG